MKIHVCVSRLIRYYWRSLVSVPIYPYTAIGIIKIIYFTLSFIYAVISFWNIEQKYIFIDDDPCTTLSSSNFQIPVRLVILFTQIDNFELFVFFSCAFQEPSPFEETQSGHSKKGKGLGFRGNTLRDRQQLRWSA